jgi:hypothetical protein
LKEPLPDWTVNSAIGCGFFDASIIEKPKSEKPNPKQFLKKGQKKTPNMDLKNEISLDRSSPAKGSSPYKAKMPEQKRLISAHVSSRGSSKKKPERSKSRGKSKEVKERGRSVPKSEIKQTPKEKEMEQIVELVKEGITAEQDERLKTAIVEAYKSKETIIQALEAQLNQEKVRKKSLEKDFDR